MAIDPVLFQAAATIVAGRIQARATSTATGIRSISSPGLNTELSEVYQQVQEAAQLIEDRQAKQAGAQSKMEIF